MKKFLYFIPAILACVFYGLIGMKAGFSAISSWVWLFILPLFISGILLSTNKWWGCFAGILVGIYVIWYGSQYHGQVLDERPVGIILCAYYLCSGLAVYKKKHDSQCRERSMPE